MSENIELSDNRTLISEQELEEMEYEKLQRKASY